MCNNQDDKKHESVDEIKKEVALAEECLELDEINQLLNDDENDELREHSIDLDLDLIYPEIASRYNSLFPLPRPKKAGYASTIIWTLLSNKIYLGQRWLNDNSDFWANRSLLKLLGISRFFLFLAFIRPIIQRTWFKVIWIILRFVFFVMVIIGVIGLTNTQNDTESMRLLVVILSTGLSFTILNVILWGFSFLLENFVNRKWDPKRSCNLELFFRSLLDDAIEHFDCNLLTINLYVKVYNPQEVNGFHKLSKKTMKDKKRLDNEIKYWIKILTDISTIVSKIDGINLNIYKKETSIKFKGNYDNENN